jgi:hypothetical protein
MVTATDVLDADLNHATAKEAAVALGMTLAEYVKYAIILGIYDGE